VSHSAVTGGYTSDPQPKEGLFVGTTVKTNASTLSSMK